MRPTTIVTALAIAGFAMGSAVAQQAPKGAQGQPQGQNQAFCLQKADGSKNCGYATMAQCDAAKKGEPTASCARNQQTTGSGMKPSSQPSQPSSNATPSNPSGSRGSANPTNPSK
jgi:hypothetical protein